MKKLSFFGLLFFVATVTHTMEKKDKEIYVNDTFKKLNIISEHLKRMQIAITNKYNLDQYNTPEISTTVESHECNQEPEIIVSLDEAKLSALFSLFNVNLTPYAKPDNVSMTRAVSNDPDYPTLFTFNASVKLAKDTDPLVAVKALTEQMKNTKNLDYHTVANQLLNMFSK